MEAHEEGMNMLRKEERLITGPRRVRTDVSPKRCAAKPVCIWKVVLNLLIHHTMESLTFQKHQQQLL